MKFRPLVAGGFAVLAAAFIVPAVSAQFHIATAARDYSFTVSTAQPWTDTGVDLQAGDILQIHSSSGENCDPAGVSGASSAGVPVVSAPAGALIARLQSQGLPVLVGSGKELKAEEPGHLFLGVNIVGYAALQWQLRSQSPDQRRGSNGTCGRQCTDFRFNVCRYVVGRLGHPQHHRPEPKVRRRHKT